MQRDQFLIPAQLGNGPQRTISYSQIVSPFLDWYSKVRSPNSSRLMRQTLNNYPKLINIDTSKSYVEVLSSENIQKAFRRLLKRSGNRKLTSNSIKTYLSPVLFFRKKVMGKVGNPLKMISPKEDYLKSYGKKVKINFGQTLGIDLAKISSLEVKLACVLAYEESLTISEMVKLRKSSFRDNYVIAIKRGRRRRVGYGPALKMLLNNSREEIFKKDGSIFTSNRGDVAVTALKQRVRKSLTEIGMDYINLSNLRKEGIVRYIERVLAPHPIEVSRNLGYRGAQNARRYILAKVSKESQSYDEYDKMSPDFGVMVRVLKKIKD